MKKWQTPRSLRTTLIYILFGSFWILLSDSVLEFFIPHTSPTYPFAQTLKGWFFILVSALLLYPILNHDETVLQKHIETEREDQRLYRGLFESNPHPMWVYDLETLGFLMVNDAAIDHYGYSREEFLKMTLKDIRLVDQISALLANLEKPPKVLEKSTGWQHVKKDGTLIDVEISSHSLNFEGKPARMVLVNDITEQKKTEQALKKSEAQFRTLVEQMPAITYIAAVDDISATLYISPQIEQVLGFTPQEFINPKETWANQIHPDDRERIFEELREGRENERPFISEYRMLTKDGKTIWISDAANLVRDVYGNPLFFEGFMLDITERKQAEDALQASERTLTLFVENAPAAIAMFDHDMKYISASRRYMVDYNLHEENILGCSHYEIFPEIPERWKEIHRRCLAGETIHEEEDPFPRADGSLDWVRWEVHPWYSSPGEIGGILLFSEVITERKRARDLLRQSEERYRNMLDNMLEGCQIIDFDWRYTYVNEAVARQGQSTPENLLGRTMMESYPGIEHTELFAKLRDCMKDRKASRFENEFLFPDGSNGWFELSIQPVPEGIFILSIDITESKLAEEQLRNSEERFRLMAENIEEGFWITDPATNYEIYLSLANERIFGLSIEELMQTPKAFLENILPEDKSLVLEKLEIQKRGESTSMEYRIRRNDGKIRWIWDRAFPILKEDGTTKYVTGLVSDITERKEIEARIQTQLKRLSALNAIDRAISSSHGIQFSLEVLLNEVLTQLGVDSAAILLLNDTNQMLEHAASRGFRSSAIHQTNMRLGEGLAGQVGMERKILHVSNLLKFGKAFKRKELLKDEGFLEYYGVPLIAKGQLKGVLEIFNRKILQHDHEWLHFLETLGGQAAIAIENAQLFTGLQQSNQELTLAYDATIAGWSHAMDLRDKETEGHTQRVTELTLKLAKRLEINEQEQVQIRRGALLHDIGKLGVPDHILLKPGKLTDEEWVIMRKHPTYAHDMLMPIAYLRPALDIPYCHHEKWDGTGYPRGLKGAEIPLAARIFAVVDVWDALRSDRPYRDGWSAPKTRDYILAESGKHFDPIVVKAFKQLLEENPDMTL